MPLRPSKRPLPKNMFHTIEFGGGKTRWINAQAKKNPQHTYVVVDPAYRTEGIRVRSTRAKYDYFPPTNTPLQHSSQTMSEFLRHMKRERLTTNRFVFRMPDPNQVRLGNLSLRELLHSAQQLLPPNGKIIITTEHEGLLQQVISYAHELGFSVRKPKLLTMPAKSITKRNSLRRIRTPQSEFEELKIREEQNVYEIEITNGLKKAIPNKNDRRKRAQKK